MIGWLKKGNEEWLEKEGSPIRDAQALDIFNRKLRDSVCLSFQLLTPFIGLR